MFHPYHPLREPPRLSRKEVLDAKLEINRPPTKGHLYGIVPTLADVLEEEAKYRERALKIPPQANIRAYQMELINRLLDGEILIPRQGRGFF